MDHKVTENTSSVDTEYWELPDGRFHREGGPAVIYADGDEEYWYNGYLHRLDGPAINYIHSSKVWYINGHEVTDEFYQWAKEMNIDLDNLSDEDKFMIRIYWENYDGK